MLWLMKDFVNGNQVIIHVHVLQKREQIAKHLVENQQEEKLKDFQYVKKRMVVVKKKNSDCLVVDCITDQMIYPETSPVSCCSIRLNEAGESIAKCEDYKGGSMGKIYKLKSRGLVCHQQAEENGEDYGGLLCEVDSENPVTSARIEIGLEMDELEMDEDKTSRDIKRLKRKITKGKKRLNHIRKNQQKK
eukprot:968404_1